MLLCQHDKKSSDYWRSYLKPTTTTDKTSPQHREVCSLCAHTVIYVCMHAGCTCVSLCVLCHWRVMFLIIFSGTFKAQYQAVTVKLLWKDLLDPHIKPKHWTSKNMYSATMSALTLGILCTMECSYNGYNGYRVMDNVQQWFAGGWIISLIFSLHAI